MSTRRAGGQGVGVSRGAIVALLAVALALTTAAAGHAAKQRAYVPRAADQRDAQPAAAVPGHRAGRQGRAQRRRRGIGAWWPRAGSSMRSVRSTARPRRSRVPPCSDSPAPRTSSRSPPTRCSIQPQTGRTRRRGRRPPASRRSPRLRAERRCRPSRSSTAASIRRRSPTSARVSSPASTSRAGPRRDRRRRGARHDGRGCRRGGILGVLGAAPTAPIVSVRVSDGQGESLSSDVIAACDWVLAHKAQYGIGVVNLSLVESGVSTFRYNPSTRPSSRSG